MNSFFVILVEKECSRAFVEEVLEMHRYETGQEGLSNEETWKSWSESSVKRFEEGEASSGKSANERWLDTIKWTLWQYIGQESQKACWDGDELNDEVEECIKDYYELQK